MTKEFEMELEQRLSNFHTLGCNLRLHVEGIPKSAEEDCQKEKEELIEFIKQTNGNR